MAKFNSGHKAYADIEDSLNAVVNHFLDDFHKEVKNNTPVGESGKAKKGWRKKGKYDIARESDQTVIENRVPYIGLLDEGSSKQAPNGMTEPAFKKLKNRRYRKRP